METDRTEVDPTETAPAPAPEVTETVAPAADEGPPAEPGEEPDATETGGQG